MAFAPVAVNKASMPQTKNIKSALIIVAAAALVRGDGRVLMQRRADRSQHGGLWEFPGGKREPDETLSACLVRELEEELGIAADPDAFSPCGWSLVPHQGGELMLALAVCRDWRGKPEARDGATIDWLLPTDIAALPMPPADVPLVAMLLAQLSDAIPD